MKNYFDFTPGEEAYLQEVNEDFDRALSPYAAPNREAVRENGTLPRNAIVRPPYFYDTDCILHNPLYNRYADKTQVFSFYRNDDLTRRALHALRTGVALLAGRPLRPPVARQTPLSGRALRPLDSLGAGLPGRPLRAFGACRALVSLLALGAAQAGVALEALRSLVSGVALGPLRTLRAYNAAEVYLDGARHVSAPFYSLLKYLMRCEHLTLVSTCILAPASAAFAQK